MELEEFFTKNYKKDYEPWQLGSSICGEIKGDGVVFIFCSEERGVGREIKQKDFNNIREELYGLSRYDFEIPICDLGDLILGKTQEDTFYILQEVVLECLKNNSIPVLIGGSNDLSYSLYSGLFNWQDKINYSQINSHIDLSNEGERITSKNFLSKILGTSDSKIDNYYHLGYHRHINDVESIKLIGDIDFEAIRLSEMIANRDLVEPFLRVSDMVTVNCDAVESVGDFFSINGQVNGINNREICAYMREIGLGQRLKVLGIFNYNIESKNRLNHQLMAHMLWYFLEGINIKKTHPKVREYETFVIVREGEEFCFKRDIFTDQWYFGVEDDLDKCIACSRMDYEDAKRGVINKRFLK